MRNGTNPRWLVGRRIVRVDMQAYKVPIAGDGSRAMGYVTLHDPIITLDNGVRLKFAPEENPQGDVGGVEILYLPRTPPAK